MTKRVKSFDVLNDLDSVKVQLKQTLPWAVWLRSLGQMRTSELIPMTISANGGQIKGKTTIQKLTYFLKFRVSVTDALLFRPHYSGPYSAHVGFQLDKMVALNFLQQSTRTTINDRIVHEYRLSEHGERVVKSLAGKYGKEFERIKEITQACKEFASLNPTTLSYAAKVRHILSKMKRLITHSRIIREASRIGWTIDQEGIRDEARLLVKLGFAKPKGA